MKGENNMNEYQKLRDRQQQKFNALPLGFASSDKQFREVMQGRGLDPEKDTDKIFSIGYGGFAQQKDADPLHKTTARPGPRRPYFTPLDPSALVFLQ